MIVSYLNTELFSARETTNYLQRYVKNNCSIMLYFYLRASASKFRCIMSAVGTILLHSPRWNESKARYETLGKQKI